MSIDFSLGAAADPKLHMRVMRMRHDLHNSTGHVLGFGEMLLEEARERGRDQIRPALEELVRGANEIIAQINEQLETSRIQTGMSDLPGLERLLLTWANQVAVSVENLKEQCS